MQYQIKLLPNQRVFFQQGSESLLEAALNAGLSVNYGCVNGNCGACKAKLIRGDIEKMRHHDYVISAAQKQAGYFLTCAHRAKSDLLIQAHEASASADIEWQNITTRVKKIQRLSAQVCLLQLQTPRTQTFRFLAGQRVKLVGNELLHSILAIASCPCDERNLQFHIQKNHSEFAHYVFEQAKYNDTIAIEGPFGDFILEEKLSQPSIFIAYETGFAPVRSLVEHSLSLQLDNPITLLLIHGATHHYMHNLARSWQDALDRFRYDTMPVQQVEPMCEQIINKLADWLPQTSQPQLYVAAPKSFCRAFLRTASRCGYTHSPIKFEYI